MYSEPTMFSPASVHLVGRLVGWLSVGLHKNYGRNFSPDLEDGPQPNIDTITFFGVDQIKGPFQNVLFISH